MKDLFTHQLSTQLMTVELEVVPGLERDNSCPWKDTTRRFQSIINTSSQDHSSLYFSHKGSFPEHRQGSGRLHYFLLLLQQITTNLVASNQTNVSS